MLNQQVTQAQFGKIVNIGQSAVSDLLSRGIIKPGMLCGAWIHDYVNHLREAAAGRGGNDGELAHQRSELARVSRERAEIKLRVERGQYVSVENFELILSTACRTAAGHLEPLHINMHKRIPDMTPEALKMVQETAAKACDAINSACLAMLEVSDEERQAEAMGTEPEGLSDFEPPEEFAP